MYQSSHLDLHGLHRYRISPAGLKRVNNRVALVGYFAWSPRERDKRDKISSRWTIRVKERRMRKRRMMV